MNPASKRARAAACTTCRTRKRRCLPSPGHPAGACSLCESLSKPCSLQFQYQSRSAPRLIAAFSPQGPPLSPDVVENEEHGGLVYHSDLPPDLIVDELISLYLSCIHDAPHTLFHPPSLLAEVSAKTTSPMLLLAICSISARFSRNSYFQKLEPRMRGQSYAKAAMDLLQQNLTQPSLVSVQSCILLSQYLGGQGDFKSKHIIIGVAMLHSQVIRLWDTRHHAELLDREIHRRTWLSVVIADRWSAADMSTTPTYSGIWSDIFPFLDEMRFTELRRNTALPTIEGRQPSDHGLWVQMAKTINTFRNINETIFLLSSGQISLSIAEDSRMNSLAHQLDSWSRNLPPKLVDSPQNLEHFRTHGFGKTFLAMHIGYHHFRQLLYFPYLDSYRKIVTAQHTSYIDLCKKHAMHVSRLARIAFQTPSCNLLYYIVGHILVVSSSIHLHTLLFSDLKEADEARDHLVSNFEILMKLKNYWPMIDNSVGRLRTFQDNCQKMMDNTFVLDNWMLKFLMEHSVELDRDRLNTTAGQPATSDMPAPLDAGFGNIGGTSEFDESALGSLRALMEDKSLSNNALVENALSWLLQ